MKRILIFVLALSALAFAQDSWKRERSEDAAKNAAKNAGEGKAPPDIAAESWLNTEGGKALSWKNLKGKVVLVDMWAFW